MRCSRSTINVPEDVGRMSYIYTMFKNVLRKIVQRPSRLFLLAAILTFIISLLTWHEVLDIHLHYTMYIIRQAYFLWVFVLCFVVLGLLYRWLHKFLPKKTFTWIHVILTLGTLLGAFIIFYWKSKIFPPIDIHAEGMTISYILGRYTTQMYVYAGITDLLAIAQFVFIYHLAYGLITSFRKKPATLS